MSEADDDKEFRVPYPLEFVISQTPLSAQGKNTNRRKEWKRTVGRHAKQKIRAARELSFLDERPLQATIYYFPPAPMDGDVDNIVKPILDGMLHIVYQDDKCIERVVVQKFEPGVVWRFHSPSPALEEAINLDKPTLYIRLDDDLAWRDAS